MDYPAGPSSGRICMVCDNVLREREIGSDTCTACHTWFNLTIDTYKAGNDQNDCFAKKNGNSCSDFACTSCKIDRYLGYNSFKNTISQCVICNSPTYVCGMEPVCSKCGILWQERNSYVKTTKCTCYLGPMCHVCCLRKLSKFMKQKQSTSLVNVSKGSQELATKTGQMGFYLKKYGVNCNISHIPGLSYKKAKKQLIKDKWCIPIKKLEIPLVPFNQKPDEYSSETSDGSIATVNKRRKRITNLFGESSDENDLPKEPKRLKLTSSTNQTYNVVSISDTCLRIKKPVIAPSAHQVTEYRTSELISPSSTVNQAECSGLISQSSSLLGLKMPNQQPYLNFCAKSHSSAVTSSFIAKDKAQRSPVFYNVKKSQPTETSGHITKKNQVVQTEGFFEDLLQNIKQFHKEVIRRQKFINQNLPPPRQLCTLYRQLLQLSIELCEPVTLRDHVSLTPPPFVPIFISDTEETSEGKVADGNFKEITSKTSESRFPKLMDITTIEDNLEISTSFRKEARVVLKRLSRAELNRYGIDLPKPSTIKKTHEKRHRKRSSNSETSLKDAAVDGTSSNKDNFSFNVSSGKNQNMAKKTVELGSKFEKHSNQTKPKTGPKSFKEKNRAKNAEKGITPLKREKKNSESEKTRVSEKIQKDSEPKEIRLTFKFPNIGRIPKFQTPQAPPSVGLPLLLQENLDRLEKATSSTSSTSSAPPKIIQKPNQLLEQLFAKPEIPTKNDKEYQDTPRERNPIEKDKVTLNSSVKGDFNKKKVLIDEKQNSIRFISPNPSDSSHEIPFDKQSSEQQIPPMPPGYVASIFDELGYVPASSPRPLVMGIRPFHPPKVRVEKCNPSVSSVPQQKSIVSIHPESGQQVALEHKSKRNWRNLSSSSSSADSTDSESDSENDSVGSSELNVDGTASNAEIYTAPDTRAFILESSKAAEFASSAEDGHLSPTSQTSDESAATVIAREANIHSNCLLQPSTPLVSESKSSDPAPSPRGSMVFSPRRGTVPAVLVSPYRDEPEELSTNLDVTPLKKVLSPPRKVELSSDSSETSCEEDQNLGEDEISKTNDISAFNENAEKDEIEESDLVMDNDEFFEEDETAKNGQISEEDKALKKENEKEQEDETDTLVIDLNEDELFAEYDIEEEPSSCQTGNQAKGGPNVAISVDHDSVAPREHVAKVQTLSNRDVHSHAMPSAMPHVSKPSELQNVAPIRNVPIQPLIPTARITPHFEFIDNKVIPQQNSTAAIVGKGMCIDYVKNGKCPPKPHETCMYCHSDDPQILFKVIQSNCASKKLIVARRLLGAMTSCNSPFHKCLKTDIGCSIVSIIINELLKDNRNDDREHALSILCGAEIPILSDLAEKAIEHAPETAKAAHSLKDLYEKYTSGRIAISPNGWKRIIDITYRFRSWQDTCDAVTTALEAQRHYCPTPQIIRNLLNDALKTKVVQRVEQACGILRGIGSQAFQSLNIEERRSVLDALSRGSDPELLDIYRRLLRLEVQQAHNPRDQFIGLQQPPAQYPPPQYPPPRYPPPPSFQHNGAGVSFSHPMQRFQIQNIVSRPPVHGLTNIAWPSPAEVSAILKNDVPLPPMNTAPYALGHRAPCRNVNESVNMAGPSNLRNANLVPDTGTHVPQPGWSPAETIKIESKPLIQPPAPILATHVVEGEAQFSTLNVSSSSGMLGKHSVTLPDLPSDRKSENEPILVVPKPSQALDQNLFCQDSMALKEKVGSQSRIVDVKAESEIVQFCPLVQHLESLFANTSFTQGKFERIADSLIKDKRDEEDAEFLMRLLSLITGKQLCDAENNNEILNYSSITARIIFSVLREGGPDTLSEKQRGVLTNFIGRMLLFLYEQYMSAKTDAQGNRYLIEAKSIARVCEGIGMRAEICTQNLEVLVFVAQSYLHNWVTSDSPETEEEIEDFVTSVARAFNLLEDFHKLALSAVARIEKNIVSYEHTVYTTALELVPFISSIKTIPESLRKDLAGAMTDYNMAASRSKRAFQMILSEEDDE